jgi:hypothetical protein
VLKARRGRGAGGDGARHRGGTAAQGLRAAGGRLAIFHVQQGIADAHCRAWQHWPGDAREGGAAMLVVGARDEGLGATALRRRARAGVTWGCAMTALAAGGTRARGARRR